MSSAAHPPTLAVHHDSWIRHQIRDLVLHLHAPVETAELLQVALIALAHSVTHYNWEAVPDESAVARAFVSEARARIRAYLVDEVRQMTHLSSTQRRRWTLIKLAREHLQERLRLLGGARAPTPEELAVATGLSVTEIGVLSRMAEPGPWEADQDANHLMELRSAREPDVAQQQRARQDTGLVMDRIAELLLQCPRDCQKVLQRHFGVTCVLEGVPVLQTRSHDRLAVMRQMLLRLFPRRLNRRAPAPLGAGTTLNPEDVWPRRLNSLLRPPVEPGHRGAWPAPT